MNDPLITQLREILHPAPVTTEQSERIFAAVKSHIGHLAGKKTSPRKAEVSRRNGKLGGGRTHKTYKEKESQK